MNQVSLRTLSIHDTKNIIKWRNMTSVKKNLYFQGELTAEQHIAYYENFIKTGKCVQFIIVVKNDKFSTDIGTVFIKNIDCSNHNGEYGIFIGEEAARGKGYAKPATELVLKYGFEVLNLHRIYLTVMSDNVPAIKTYESVGFIREGVLREEYMRANGYVDVVMMSMLRREWNAKER